MDESEKRDTAGDRVSKDARDWVVRLASGGITDADLARFKAWRDASAEHARAFTRERAFWQQLSAIDPRPQRAPAPRNMGRRAFLMGGSAAIAASIAIVAAPRLQLLWQADYRTAAGEQADISLPDGTRVTLNTDSALALRFRPDLRLVELLQGEALFEVRPDGAAPFRVAALGGYTDTLSAAFAVRALDNQATITATKGEASVFSPARADQLPGPQSAALAIKADQQTSYLRGRAPVPALAVDLDQTLAWRSGRVIFDGRSFADALAELGRYVPERIVLADRSRTHDPVSAIFSIRQAGAAIAALAETQGLTARRIPGVMIVIS
jgi:transmembrane sensor